VSTQVVPNVLGLGGTPIKSSLVSQSIYVIRLKLSSPSSRNNLLEMEGAIPPKKGDKARPSTPTHPSKAVSTDVHPLGFELDDDWPDEIELLKQIERDDGENLENEFKYLAKHRGTRPKDREPNSETLVTLQAPGKIEMKRKRMFHNQLDYLCQGSGQMKQLSIHSSHLRGLFKEVVDFYPAVNLNEHPLVLHRPQSLLFHFLPSLEEISKRLSPDDRRYRELRVLLFLCDKHLSMPFGLMRRTLEAGEVFYAALEALFRPGITLVAKDFLGHWQAFMCVQATVEDFGAAVCTVIAWYLAWNDDFGKFELHWCTEDRLPSNLSTELLRKSIGARCSAVFSDTAWSPMAQSYFRRTHMLDA
jgi:hypothetical protein